MKRTAIALAMVLSAGTAGAVVVNFPDPNLEAAVRSSIDIPSGPINDTDLVGTGFTILNAQGLGITNLTGLEYCTDLTNLWLSNNEISDIGAVAGLTNLTVLRLSTNQISDISDVVGLTSLDRLWLSMNQISDISAVAGLTSLTDLSLGGNQISDISALVANAELGSGDSVALQSNPLSQQALCIDIPAIEARGASVTYDGTCQPALPIVYVDFAAGSPTGTGAEIDPVDRLSDALFIVEVPGVVRIKVGSSTETMTIDQDVTIEAVNGEVLIGVSGGRSAGSDRQWGFVSRDYTHLN